ncbi:MAG TPA: ChaB family protein [Thermoleophilaceae bacterium]|nr:ChaB family protein [Thermoleophilaceae bacterium]
MPKTKKDGKPIKEELPRPVRRSPEKAQRTFAKAHDSAAETYGEGERAHRTAYSALKHSYEKRDDRWVPKDQKGPSDPRAKDPRARERSGQTEGTRTFGGVDVEGNSKRDLYERAKELEVEGRSSMSKEELAEALARKGG